MRLEDGAEKREASARKNGLGKGAEQMAERVRDAIGQGQLGGECAEIARRLRSKGVDLAEALSPGNETLWACIAAMGWPEGEQGRAY